MWLLDLVGGVVGLVFCWRALRNGETLLAIGFGAGGTLLLYGMVLRLTGGFA